MNGIRILIALAAVALAAFVAAAPASSQALGAGTPLVGDPGVGLQLPDLGGGLPVGGGSGGRGGGGGGGGGAANGNAVIGDASADVHVSCIEAAALGITATVGNCPAAGGGGGNGGGGNGGGGGNDGAADAGADAGDVGAGLGVGCIDLGLGELGDGLQIGSCDEGTPPAEEDPGEGSGELPADADGGEGVAGAGADGDGGVLGDEADCIAYDETSSAGTPYGIPPWLAGIVGVAMFALGAAVTRRRRPQAEDVAV
jgi:hypothetical protein